MRFGNALPANTIAVTNINDSGPGSLRDALEIANDGDTIDATGVSGTILLTSGQLNVDKDVIITGPGANNLAVDGNAQSGVFYVNPSKTVTVSGLTITNTNNGGGSIYNDGGELTLSDCIVSGNFNAGIINDSWNSSATMTVTNSTISGNSGSGIANTATQSAATMTVNNCTVSGNSGSGIVNEGLGDSATMTVSNSTISSNSYSGIVNGAAFLGSSAAATVIDSTISGNSGGIVNAASVGPATVAITNSTVSGNSAVWGGGIFNGNSGQGAGASVIVSNSTISTNSADYGGAIYNASSTGGDSFVTVSNSAISGNSAGNGGGIYNSNAGGVTALDIGNTVLKTGSLGENIVNFGGTVTSFGYNLSSDNAGGVLHGPGDQTNIDPRLGPLQNNGGPTFTHALLPDSPAIDAGDPSFTPPPFYDQRGAGFDRVANGRIDIGSFEVQGPRPTPTPRPSPTPRIRPTPRPRS